MRQSLTRMGARSAIPNTCIIAIEIVRSNHNDAEIPSWAFR